MFRLLDYYHQYAQEQIEKDDMSMAGLITKKTEKMGYFPEINTNVKIIEKYGFRFDKNEIIEDETNKDIVIYQTKKEPFKYNNMTNNIEFKDSIIKLDDYKYTYKFKTNNYRLKIHCKETDNIEKIVKELFMIQNWLRQIYETKIKTKHMVWLSGYKKEKDREIIEKNINSAQTAVFMNIQQWRKEELLKVFIHEFLHYHQIDLNKNESLLPMEKIYNQKILYNEGIVEAIACILNAIYYHKREQIKIGIEKMIKMEMIHNLLQIKKILQHNKVTKPGEIDDKLRLKSNVYAYYFVKFGILCELCKHVLTPQILSSANNKELYAKMAKKICGDLRNEKSEIGHYIWNNISKIQTDDLFIKNNLMMSFYELKIE